MHIKNLKENFLKFCIEKKYKKNKFQIEIIEDLSLFYHNNQKPKSLLKKLLSNKQAKLGFYLYGDVGVGKTMLLNFFYNSLSEKKVRLHFNEFMIKVHDFLHINKDKSKSENLLDLYAKNFRKNYEYIYFDEFQVTNIVDAMILGKLFSSLFNENIKVIITSNTKIDDLYQDGLQREQFIPFIKIFKKYCIEKQLNIGDDYRKSTINNLDRFFYPINEENNFKKNKLFRELTKNKINKPKRIIIKSREFVINNYFEGVAKFGFDDLCKKNLAGEDYIKIAEQCNCIVLENIPNFSDDNLNEQYRFITLIDILYEKKILLVATSEYSIDQMGSANKLTKPFKRTLSRLHELTSVNFLK
jgi:cell division protein ZapE